MSKNKKSVKLCDFCGSDVNLVIRPIWSTLRGNYYCDMECYKNAENIKETIDFDNSTTGDINEF